MDEDKIVQEPNDVQRLDTAVLEHYIADIFSSHGLTPADAQTCAAGLTSADLRGVWSHGVARVPMYCRRLEQGVAKARPEIGVLRLTPAAALVDGDDGLGLVVAKRAMAEAIALSGDSGIGLVGVRRSGHFGMAALYASQAIEADRIGMVFTNASRALPPWGGAAPFFGTSPFAFGAPTGGDTPFLIDMAMSIVARGKLKFAAQRGQPIPPGLALDRQGRPTTDGRAAFEGIVMPFGGVKGAALSWMMDVLGGVFTGAAFAGEVGNPFTDLDRAQDTGHVMLAIRADLFMPKEIFEARMQTLAQRAKAQPRAEDVGEILSPGEPEARQHMHNTCLGVPVTADIIAAIKQVGRDMGVAWPFD